MKISHRLLALSGFSAAGLLCVAAVSYVAVTSIQSDLRNLTLHATPLQTKSYEVQERTERMLGALLRLSLARSGDEVQKASAGIAADMAAIDRLRDEMRALDPNAGGDLAEFRSAQQDIRRAVDKRLGDEAAYRADSDSASVTLKKAAEAVQVTRAAVNQIGVDAGRAADAAQDAGRRLSGAMKSALMAQARLKEIELVVGQVDTASNRFRLGPLKEKVKSPVDSLLRIEAEKSGDKPGDDVLKDVRTLAAGTLDAFGKEGSGLLALRADVLAGKPDADAAYQRQRKAILAPIEEQVGKLSAVVDATEVQAVKQRQQLEAALRLRNEPGGVVVTSEEVSLGIRDMVASLRLLMLSASEAEVATAQADLKKLSAQLSGGLVAMRGGLLKMGRPPLAQQVDAALAAMTSVSASVEKVTLAKKSLLASEGRMAASLAQLKAVAARQATAGEAQARSLAGRQAEVTAAVDARVQSSLVAILGIAAAIIVATGLLVWRTVRVVTSRLDAAVNVAEAVSRGELVEVDVGSGTGTGSGQIKGNDETTRLLAALGSMVATLTGIVGNIRSAADQIKTGSADISRGNRDLSDRTEHQASSLQQTAASVAQLNTTVRSNADSAREAHTLAGTASDVAMRGGAVVTQVVDTMADIHASSTRIADIVGVIDGIAFQTNILALNAAVEAARAGEHGRGFAVVASEVRALAKKSADAARQVKSIITASVGKIETGSTLVRQAGVTMTDIVTQVRQVTDLVSVIARASEEQAAAVGEVSASVHGLDETTQRNAALAEQGTAAAATLSEQAQVLAQAISVFKTAPQLAR